MKFPATESGVLYYKSYQLCLAAQWALAMGDQGYCDDLVEGASVYLKIRLEIAAS